MTSQAELRELPSRLLPWDTVKELLKGAWDEGYDVGGNDVGSGWREEELTPNPYQEDE